MFYLDDFEIQIQTDEMIGFFNDFGIVVEKEDINVSYDTVSFNFSSTEYNGSAKPETLTKIKNKIENLDLVNLVVIDTNLYLINIMFDDDEIGLY